MGIKRPPEDGGDSIGFLDDFFLGEVDDAIAGCFEGKIGTAFIGISMAPTWTVDLHGEALLLPQEVDPH